MTTTLLPGLLRTVARNVSRGTGDLALFETAPVTLPHSGVAAPILPVDRRPTDGEWDDLNKALPDQPLHLAFAVCGDRDRAGWWGDGSPAPAGATSIETAAGRRRRARSRADRPAGEPAPWHPGRCAELVLGEAVVGHAGELHPKVCRAFGVPARTVGRRARPRRPARAGRGRALRLRTSRPTRSPRRTSPSSSPTDLPAAELAATLREGAGPLCESVRLFDVYTGPQVGEGHKSLAFALRFRAPDRTLTEKETAAARDAAVALAAQRHGAQQRSLTAQAASPRARPRPGACIARSGRPASGGHHPLPAPRGDVPRPRPPKRRDVRRRRTRSHRGTATRSRRSPRTRWSPRCSPCCTAAQPGLPPEAGKGLRGRTREPVALVEVGRAGVERAGDVPERAQHLHPAGVVPDVRRDRPSTPDAAIAPASSGAGSGTKLRTSPDTTTSRRRAARCSAVPTRKLDPGVVDAATRLLDEAGARVDREHRAGERPAARSR